ncbi:META domain-containing protein [Aequorivita sublithincola]|nr:META domain-containing protein [Aequorivita sublithincola]
MRKQIMTLTIIALAMVGCNSAKNTTSPTNENNLEGTSEITQSTWELITLQGQPIDQNSTDKKINFQLNEIDKAITGFSGCNTFRGNYSLESGNRISFTQLASTRMACPDALINESEFMNALGKADNYSIEDGFLSLNKTGEAPLTVFKKVTSENLIKEKYWKLKTLEGKSVAMADNQEREIFFTLKNDNRVNGFAGCNNISGEYTIEKGNRIRFKNMATTLRACPDVDVNESELLNVFNTADNYTINGDVLNLNVGRRAPLAVFEAVYMQ